MNSMNRTKRISRTLLSLLLAFAVSTSFVFAATDTSQSTQPNQASAQTASGQPASASASKSDASSTPKTKAAATPQVGVVQIKDNYYYKDPKTSKIRKTAGFVKWKGDRYYITKGGKIQVSKTFKVGKYHYRARKNGKIAVGVYKWSGKLNYSDPKTGRWIKDAKFIKWEGKKYYIQKGGQVITNQPFVVKNTPYVAAKDGSCTKLAIIKPNNGVLKTAQKQVGIMTGRKYWNWYFGTRFIDTDRTPWCACFAAWCYNNAGKYHRISKVRRYGNLGYVPSYVRYANDYGKWINKKKAKGGDLIVFGNRGRHIGIVERVYKGYIFTIEGNSGPTAAYGCGKPGAVTRKVYKLDDKDIKGVIRAL